MTLPATRDLLEDERLFIIAARVALHDGESEFFRKTAEGATEVSVRSNNHGLQMWATVRGGSNSGRGEWQLPEAGDEVLVGCEDGDPEGDVYLIGVYGHQPAALTTTQILLLINDVVEARSAAGTAQSLAFLSELNSLISKVNDFIGKFNAHTHILTISGGNTGTAAVPANPETTQSNANGTQKFKAE